MTRVSGGLRHGSIAAAPRPIQCAISALPGDNPRFRDRPGVVPSSRSVVKIVRADELSPFVLGRDDSKSRYADPRRTSLALSDRLAGDQPDRALHPRRRAVRAVPAAAWAARGTTHRCRWRLVGCRCPRLAGRARSPATPGAVVRRARCHQTHSAAGLSCDRPSQSRSDRQRSALAQPRRALPAMSHAPRCGRAPPTPLVECLSPPRARRSLHWPLWLSNSLNAPPSRRRRALVVAATNPPRGEDAVALRCDGAGGRCDGYLPDSQDDRDGATAA